METLNTYQALRIHGTRAKELLQYVVSNDSYKIARHISLVEAIKSLIIWKQALKIYNS